ncbi:MAG: hypothetical protein CM1200mP22_07170 [Dehalococcoidia bacterium]|nr:MAG: hypothetical protein CM1200mP22_07170 [Dehalococcoidia bacterium]
MVKFSDRWGNWPLILLLRSLGSSRERAAGADVVTFGIGDPDIPTPQPIIDGF